MPQAILGMELSEIQQALGPGEPEFRARQVYEAIYHAQVPDLVQITTLPGKLRQRLASGHTVGLPGTERRFESSDGTRRYLLRLEDGRTVETVWMPEENRDTICISSQVGCPVDCKFCMTALMGMGEPLLNLPAVLKATRILTDADGVGLSERRITLSTAGLIPQIAELG